jgi:subtilase family serine protease
VKSQRFFFAAGMSFWLLSAGVFPAVAAPGRQMLRGHVPEALARFHLQPVGRLAATNVLHLAVGLPLRNKEALTNLLQQLCDPASPNFRHYLTPEQFTEQFGPTKQDYQKVIAFAGRNGLKVTGTSANRMLLEVSAPVPDIEKAFQVTIRTYHHPKENRMFYSPDAEPSVEAGVPVLDVSGLSDYGIPRPQNLKVMQRLNPANAVPNAGSGPSGYYRGNDFRAAYLPGVTLNGTGQTVGLLEFDGYYPSDITTYESQSGLPSVPLQIVPIGGGVSSPGSDNIEVALDIEVTVAMATNLSAVVVYEAPNNTSYFNSLLNSMVASNHIKQFSCSWSYSGTPSLTTDQIFQQMISQGQSFFDAAGDKDAYTGSSGVPNDDPYITIVGGTTLSTTGPGGSWTSETVWNDRTVNPNGGNWGGSGGISTYYSLPAWQQGVNMMTNLGSTTMRNLPDVALTANQVWCVRDNGTSSGYVEGTSIAAPLWAALTALVNQQAVAGGGSTVGFINPVIYEIGRQSSYTSDFHDTTVGDNTWSGSPNQFYAQPGYDLCTGWGTPNGQSLVNALVNPDPLVVSPLQGFASSGNPGGPFSVTSQIISLTNAGTASLNWSVGGVPSWLTVSPGDGTLTAGGNAHVTVSLNSVSSNLVGVAYLANVWFTNQTSGIAHARFFTLQVASALAISSTNGFTSSGSVGGPFSVTSQNFTLTNFGPASLNWGIINTSSWLNVSPASGILAGYARSTLTVSLTSAAGSLAAGIYNANLLVTNEGGGAVSLPFTLIVGQSLVKNGGFEAGSFISWSQSGNGSYTTVISGNSQFVHSGTFGAELGPAGSLGYLSQTLPTLAGQNYLLSLWMDSPNIAGTLTPNEFTVSWNGGTIFDWSNIGKIGWTNLQFIVTASSSSTILQLGFRDDPYYLGLDDISVTPIALPNFQTSVAAANAFKLTWGAVTGLVYQVQYKTNLLQANWSNLGGPITATGATLTISDTNALILSPRRFYRLMLSSP